MSWIPLHYELATDTPVYGNFNAVQIEKASCMESGDGSNGLFLNFHNHVGTHVDCPRHFDAKGKTLSEYKVSDWIFDKVQFLEIPLGPEEFLKVEHLAGKINSDTEALIIRSNFYKYRQKKEYWNNNPGVCEEVGLFFREQFPNLKIFGFDFISVTSFQDRPRGRISHKNILASHLASEPLRIVEDMKLDEINSDPEQLIISPLPIKDGDGAPVTVFAKI